MLFKKIIRKILNLFLFFGIKISINKARSSVNYEYIDKNLWIPFFDQINNNYMKIYYEGLYKSESQSSDNFSKKLRFYSLFQIINYISKKKYYQNFAECGCWNGHSSYCIAKILEKNNFNKQFYIFDSFELGLSAKTEKDKINLKYKQNVNEEKKQKKYFFSNYNKVIDLLKKFYFIKIYKGWIPDIFNSKINDKFSFIHIDLDLYEPTLKSLNFFYPKLIIGGIIVCDDYNISDFPGAKKAIDEFLHLNKVSFFYEISFGGCIIVK